MPCIIKTLNITGKLFVEKFIIISFISFKVIEEILLTGEDHEK